MRQRKTPASAATSHFQCEGKYTGQIIRVEIDRNYGLQTYTRIVIRPKMFAGNVFAHIHGDHTLVYRYAMETRAVVTFQLKHEKSWAHDVVRLAAHITTLTPVEDFDDQN